MVVYSLRRMRHSPSTSTRAVLSGNFTIFARRTTQPTLVQIVGRGIGDFGPALEHGAHEAVAGHDVVNELDARPGLHQQRRDGAGKNDDVREPEDGQRFRAANATKCGTAPPDFRWCRGC